MVALTKGQAGKVWLTLSEKATLDNPNFLFIATHKTTKQDVKVVLKAADDLSPATSRFNAWEISSDAFEDAKAGQYDYMVYEQESDDNTDPAQAGAVVEIGLMDLYSETPEVERVIRETSQTFTVR